MNEPVYWIRNSESKDFLSGMKEKSKRFPQSRFIIYADDDFIGTMKNGIFYSSNVKK